MKVLISGSNYYGYNNSIGNAFQALNHEVKLSNYPDDKDFLFLFEQISKNIFPHNKRFEFSAIEYNRNLIRNITDYNPDFFLAFKGDLILPDTMRKLKTKLDITTAIWCSDSAIRSKNILDGCKYYDYFFTFEPSDISPLKKYGIEAKFLPMAYDPDNYYKKDLKKGRDIIFVGIIDGYPERVKIFESILVKKKELNFEIWGGTWYNPLLYYRYKFKNKILRNHIVIMKIGHNKINALYNSSKICMNIHHPQSKDGINPRTFEILGSGGFQISDYKTTMENYFKLDNEICCFTNQKDLFEKIEYYLHNEKEREKIAINGHKTVMKYHTFKNRAINILNEIEKI